MWKEIQMENKQIEHMPRQWKDKGSDENRDCDGRYALRPRDRELVGEEWRIRAKDRRRNWRLLVVIVVSEK